MGSVYLSFLITLAWIGLLSAPLQAQVRGTIVGPGAERYPIAVSALKNLGQFRTGKLSSGVANTIARDLELSGWFRVLDRSAYIENPQRTGIAMGEFDFRDWSTLGAEALVKGGYHMDGQEVTVELRLYDVFQQKLIVGKRYQGKARDFRRIAHKFADEVILQFTNVEGIFNTRVAYVSTTGGRFKEIFVSHLDGSEKVQVTNNRTINLFPSWNSDGRSLLYVSYKDGSPKLYHYDLFSGIETKISSKSGLNLGGRWSPDRRFIAVSFERRKNIDLYLLDQGGKILRRLTYDSGDDLSPSWSPDGNNLAFVSNRSGTPQLYIMDVNNGRSRRLTFSGGYNTSPDWSPKGEKIAFTGRSGGRFQIYTIEVEGGEPRQLTRAGDNEDPVWSPDGRFVLFTSNRTGRYQLYLMQGSGENQRRLTVSGGDDTNPTWSPRLP